MILTGFRRCWVWRSESFSWASLLCLGEDGPLLAKKYPALARHMYDGARHRGRLMRVVMTLRSVRCAPPVRAAIRCPSQPFKFKTALQAVRRSGLKSKLTTSSLRSLLTSKGLRLARMLLPVWPES
jgi:hypothetical protein